MNRILLFAASATLLSISGNTWSQDIPDVNLRDILNGAFPGGLTDANGDIVNPDPYLFALDIASDASLPPIDLTGLDLVSCSQLRITSQPGGSFTNFPAFPTMVGPDASITIDLFDGPELPPLPMGLSVFLLWSPQPTLQSWYLNGHDDGVDLNVEVNDLPAGSPWAMVTEHLNYISIAAYPHVAPPLLGSGISGFALFGALEMTTMPVFDTDLQSLQLMACPLITSISFAGQVDTLQDLSLDDMAGLTTISEMPVVDHAILFQNLPQLGPVAFAACPGELRMNGVIASALTMLPAGLEELYLNGIENLVLPPLPTSLRVLNIDYSIITHLSPFHEGIEELIIQPINAPLCIPHLPSTLTYFDGTGVACFPNQPPMIAPLTLCTILNSYCPEVSAYAKGHVFYDYDEDGIQSSFEPNARNLSIITSPTGRMVGTDNEGNYSIGLTNGQHSLALSEFPAPFDGSNPLLHTVDLASVLDSAVGLDFTVFASQGLPVDRSIDFAYHTDARPGFEHDVYLDCSILGLHGDTTVLTIEFDTAAVFVSTDLIYESIVDHTMTIRHPPNSISAISGHIRLLLPPTTELGYLLKLRVGIGPNMNDTDPSNDSLNVTYPVVGSFDPNDKKVTPETLSPDEVASDTLVEYAIRFQNTGTYLAERVLITDTLSSDLRWDSFRFMHSSHPCVWFMRDGVVHFVFNDIMLPDSTSDEPGSHGFVRFSIRPDQGLVAGSIVSNEANIYFDFNEPVITDPCELLIQIPQAITELGQDILTLFPVPASDRITISLPVATMYNGVVIGSDGREMRTFKISGDRVTLDIEELPSGHFVVQCTDRNGGVFKGRFVKIR